MIRFIISFTLACGVVFILLAGGLKLGGYYEPEERELVVQPLELLSDSHTLDLADLLREDKDAPVAPRIEDVAVLEVPVTIPDTPDIGETP